jgi:hypothetical protein
MHFPAPLYRTPGPYRKGKGLKTYRVAGAKDQAQYDAMLAKGWFASYEEAVAGKRADEIVKAAEEFNDSLDEVSGPTREELEQKAEELGIGYNKRTSNRKLAERITAALEG